MQHNTQQLWRAVNIFVRLLAKQLAQMRAVSKSWNALLSQPSFIKSHLHRSIHNNDQILLVFHYKGEYVTDFKPLAALPRRSPHLELTNFIKLAVNPRRPKYTDDITIIGAVNGLICSSYGDSVIQIWNPSLSAILTLPPSYMYSRGHDSMRMYFGFGFDPKTNDYKVTKLTGLVGLNIHTVELWLPIEIYSMSKGTWEFITGRFTSHNSFIISHVSVCVDGHLYWLCYIGKKFHSVTIVAFDLGSQTFGEILPPDCMIDNDVLHKLGVLSGKLCVTSQLDVGFEVWVMEEYGVAKSWVKHHVFSHFGVHAWPVGFTSLGEFLIRGDASLIVYDPVANKQEVLEVLCLEEYGVNKVVEYIDSLVWIAPAKHEMVDGGNQNRNGEPRV